MPYSCQMVSGGRCIVNAISLYASPANKNHALNSIVGAAFGGKLIGSVWTLYAHESLLKLLGNVAWQSL